MEAKKVWFVAGDSKGGGALIREKLLQNGYHVVAATRNTQHLIDEIGEVSEIFLLLEVGLTDNSNVKTAI